jgi:hypothetical protein
MRPRKLVVLIEADESGRGVRAMALWLWHYRPCATETACEVLADIAEPGNRMYVLAVRPSDEDKAALIEAKLLNPKLRVLSLEPPNTPSSGFYADLRMPANSDPRFVRDQLKILTARRSPTQNEKVSA